MGRRRTRLVAAAIVIVTALASAAYGDFSVTSNPAQSGSGWFGQPMRVVVSIRNITASTLTISSVFKAAALNCPTSVTATPLLGGAFGPLAPNEQVQVVISSTGFSMTEAMMGISCPFMIVENPLGATDFFTVNFSVSSSGTTWDLQPQVNDFGTQAASEVQRVLIQNDSPSAQTFVTMQITDPTNSLTFVSRCNGQQSCAGVTVAANTAFPIDIKCMPTAQGPIAGTLSIFGASTVLASKPLQCAGPLGGGPMLQVMPTTISAPQTAVGMTSGPFPITITNLGTGTVTAGPLAFTGDWSSPTLDPCVASACTLGAGASATLHTSFAPTTFGNRDSSVLIGTVNVSLIGSGSGGTIDVTAPPGPAFEIDFGTIPKGAAGASRAVSMIETGNVGLTVSVGNPGPPFSVSPSSVPLIPGTPTGFDVHCGSVSPGGPFTASISLASGAYHQNTTSVGVRCTVADTGVEVSPTTFDVHEVRVGAAPVTIPISIHNPTAAPVALTRFALSASSSVLALSPTVSGTTPIAAGASFAATLTLTPTSEVDLAGLALLIDVDGAQLAYPITGKVVVPKVHVTPASLDLGTACIGTQVSGTMMMVNDGTATLTMQPPSVDRSFTLVYTSPTDYPIGGAPLLAGHSAMVDVIGSAASAGVRTGTLTWEVDAPHSPFTVPISLSYIASGTAVSPSQLSFGTVSVDTRSSQQAVIFENCDDGPVNIRIDGVFATQGRVDAWTVSPHTGETVLASHKKLSVAVEFAPTKPGHYDAHLDVEINGDRQSLELQGDAVGGSYDQTSFYACTCSGPGAPSRGWPIALAIGLAVRPRRRRRVSDPIRTGSS